MRLFGKAPTLARFLFLLGQLLLDSLLLLLSSYSREERERRGEREEGSLFCTYSLLQFPSTPTSPLHRIMMAELRDAARQKVPPVGGHVNV